ncbi:MAG: xanthine dehydrogenase molybdopterin binding subunit [Candidatus Puniceispirillales bacterium]
MTMSSLHHPVKHDSATLYVTGEARYIDDIAFPADGLHIALGLSDRAHARITHMDLSECLASTDVVTVLTASDIPGKNDASPVFGDDPIFAEQVVAYHGQAIFAVVAKSAKAARMATAKARITYADLPAILTIEDALEQNHLLEPPYVLGDETVETALADAPFRLSGSIRIGGQEHFYLEGQAAYAMPGESGDITLSVSSQHPTEVQHKVAHALALPFHTVTVDVRRMGGGFGGKESQSNLPSIIAALAAHKTGCAAKLVYDRDEDMRVTGKRHDMLITYDVGYDDTGRIMAMDVQQALRCGMSYDLSQAIAERAVLHAHNCYAINHVRVTSRLCRTHTPSNTAFRGFGGPQGMLAMERVIEEVAAALHLDPVVVRQRNYFADWTDTKQDQCTPYQMPVRDGIINVLTDQLLNTSDYFQRRQAIEDFNQSSTMFKRGIGFAPVMFGISFNKTILNQAGALIHIYTDGSVHLNHGGTEMGQGLYTKTRQICAHAFGIPDDMVKMTATSTGKVPNTSATAASSGTDLNGMATKRAADTLKDRMAVYLSTVYQTTPDQVQFGSGQVCIGDERISFAEAASLCWQGRVSLSSTGFYATPDIHWDRQKGCGAPFYYFAYGAAVSEVTIDMLTGENRVNRVDILHDVGQSINPAIDLGQIEGGFIQGMGWLMMEELIYDDKGRLMTHAPSTYKIPACSDRPDEMHIHLFESDGNRSDTIHKSKAVGEPPFMLAMSVYGAVNHALSHLGSFPCLDTPMTAEHILMTATQIKASGQS